MEWNLILFIFLRRKKHCYFTFGENKLFFFPSWSSKVWEMLEQTRMIKLYESKYAISKLFWHWILDMGYWICVLGNLGFYLALRIRKLTRRYSKEKNGEVFWQCIQGRPRCSTRGSRSILEHMDRLRHVLCSYLDQSLLVAALQPIQVLISHPSRLYFPVNFLYIANYFLLCSFLFRMFLH